MGGIVIDTTVFNITTWFNMADSLLIGPPTCQYNIGPSGNFPSSTLAAPVITAVVGEFL